MAQTALRIPRSGEDAARILKWDRATRYYNGGAPARLNRIKGEPDDNVRLSARPIVKTLVAALTKDFSINLGELKGTPAEDWFKQAWPVERLRTQFQLMSGNGCRNGMLIAKLMPIDLDHEFPRVIVVEPRRFFVDLDPQDYEHILGCGTMDVLEEVGGRPYIFRQLAQPIPVGHWTVFDAKSYNGRDWEPIEDHDWPYAKPPFRWAQNLPTGEFWGEEDLVPEALDIIDALNLAYTTTARVERMFTPITTVDGATAKQLEQANDKSVGAITILPAGAHLNIEQPTRGAELTFINRLEERLEDLTGVPAVSADRMSKLGTVSGVALQIVKSGLIDRVEMKRPLAGPFMVDLAESILELGGHPVSKPLSPIWGELIPGDPVAERTAAQADLTMGVASKATIAAKLGYVYKDEAEQIKAEREADAAANPVTDPNAASATGAGAPDSMPADQLSAMLTKMGAARRKPAVAPAGAPAAAA